jgi:uncharacterized protein
MYNGYKFIDSDAHILEPPDIWERYLEPQFRAEMPRSYVDYKDDPLGFGIQVVIKDYTMPFSREFSQSRILLPGLGDAYEDFARKGFPPQMYRLAMERTGIDYMVVYPTVGLYATAVPQLSAATAAAYRRAYNNWLADFCREAGGQVLGVASVDLRDPEAAIKEARRCVKDFGFKAVHVTPTPVGEQRLYHPCYDPLWAAIVDLDVPVGVHVSAGNAADVMLYHYLPDLWGAQSTMAFTIGNMVASAALIMGGVLERHPRLKVVHLESGAGWAAFWLDRLAAGVNGGFRGIEIPGLKLHPLEYFQRQCYISADQDDPGIKQVIEVLGDDNLVTATDFSHPEGRRYSHAIEELLALPGVSTESKRKIMWDNAAKLYNITAP